MNPTLITDLLTYALPSDLLCEKYNDVLQENVTLRREKADWLVAQQELLRKIDKLTREVEGLRKNFNRTPPQKNR